MRNRYFLISIVLHVLLLTIIYKVHLTVRVQPSRSSPPIVVIPMSPPLTAPPPVPPRERQQSVVQLRSAPRTPEPQPVAPRPIVVRPFVIPATPGERGGGPAGDQLPPPESEKVRPEITPAKPPTWSASTIPVEKVQPEGAFRPMKLIYNPVELERLLESGKSLVIPPGKFDSKVDFLDRLGLGDGSGGGDPNTATGGSVFFDAGGYDITPWAQRAVYRVKKNWIMPLQAGVGISGVVGVYLVIRRDGRIDVLEVKKQSGSGGLDQAAVNALKLSIPFAELPADFPNRDLPAYFIFHYN
jgi:periplasmic protein TonB